jgi:hypothetical protein
MNVELDDAATPLSRLKFPKDWPAVRAITAGAPSVATWTSIADVVLRGRLNRLYFDPIHQLTREPGTPGRGEGFSILTIQCSVLEFLAALRKGWSFKHGHRGEGKDNYYGNSKSLYVSFLIEQHPFARSFTTHTLANEFYTDVRCGLVHEGQTKNGWRIWRGTASSPLVDFEKKAIYRDVMQREIETYLQRYCIELQGSAELQQAFVRKFDHLYANTVLPSPTDPEK